MLKFYKIFLFSFFIAVGTTCAQRPLIFVVDLSKGTTNDAITLQTAASEDINYSWTGPGGTNGTGTIVASPSLAASTISGLPASATVEISLSSNLKAVSVNVAGQNAKLIDIKQWGDVVWANMTHAFRDCINLTNITATDLPNLSQVTNMSYMFYGSNLLNGPANIGSWDVSNVENMAHMFRATGNTPAVGMAFNQDISAWNTARVTTMTYMFYNCRSFNQDISNWNTGNVVNFTQMFANAVKFNQPVGKWDVSKATDLSYFFTGATVFNKPLGDWTLNAVGLASSTLKMAQMLQNSGINCVNYSGTLNGWVSKGNLPTGTSASKLSFSATGRQYGTSATVARQTLIDTHFWSITNDVANAGACANATPVANADTYAVVNTNGTAKLSVQDNDTDADTDLLWVSSAVTPTAGGTVKVISGNLYFTPQPGYNGSVSFDYTITDGKGGYATGNVTIPVDVPVLPVKLLNYHAKATATGITLDWVTATEQNNNRYEVEKSIDGNSYSKLGTVYPNPSFSYSLEDKNPEVGTNYYALYQYDNDGTKTSLGIRSVKYGLSTKVNVLVYPNPVVDVIKVNLTSYKDKKVNVALTDLTGRVIYRRAKAVSDGNFTLDYKPNTGFYVLRLTGNNLNEALKITVK